MGRRKSRDARNVIANRGAANGFFVVERFAPQRCVDYQIDFTRFDEVDDVRPAFVYFKNRLRGDSCRFQSRRRAARREQAEAKIVKFFSKGAKVPFVAIIDAEKNRALAWQPLSRREL